MSLTEVKSNGWIARYECWAIGRTGAEDRAAARTMRGGRRCETARAMSIELTPEHWEAIRFMRTYYQEHRVPADARFVMRHLTETRSTSRLNDNVPVPRRKSHAVPPGIRIGGSNGPRIVAIVGFSPCSRRAGGACRRSCRPAQDSRRGRARTAGCAVVQGDGPDDRQGDDRLSRAEGLRAGRAALRTG